MNNEKHRTNTRGSKNRTPSDLLVLHKHGFELTNKLGQGGYGKVYLVDYINNNIVYKNKFACKIIESHNKILPAELNIIIKLNHPHIIEIHSIFQRKDKYFIFMRLAENGDLLDYILKEGPIHEKLAKIWIRQLSLALQYLHILEIAHRDIKCENILITSTNNVKLADFGFSRNVIDVNNQLILSETYCGSISYASPQILTGEPYLPKSTDMWSFGCLIYVMLNKSFPFDSSNIKTMIEDQLTKNYKFRTKYINKYNEDVIDLVYGLLEPNEKLRYKIDNVIGSMWITMETSLRVLNKYEFAALEKAKLLANINNNEYEPHKEIINMKEILTKHKLSKESYDLHSIHSSIKNHRKLST